MNFEGKTIAIIDRDETADRIIAVGVAHDPAPFFGNDMRAIALEVAGVMSLISLPKNFILEIWDESVDERVAEILRAESKIAAIKYYRKVTGARLKDAKDYVDEIERKIKRTP